MRLRVRVYILQLAALSFSYHSASSQQLTFSQQFNSIVKYADYSLIHYGNNKIFVLGSSLTAEPEILVYNDSLIPVDRVPAKILRFGNPLAVTGSSGNIRMLTEYPTRGMNNYRAIELDSSGNTSLLKDIVTLRTDSSTIWSFVKSPGQLFFLLYKVNQPENDSISINFTVLDKNWDVHVSGLIEVPFSTEFDRLNPVYIDDDGRTWITIFDQPLNYKLGSTIHIYTYKKGDEKLRQTTFYTKEKKPVEFSYLFNQKQQTAVLQSLYTGFFSKDIEGYLSGMISNSLELVKPFTEYEFGKEIKKEMQKLTSGITRDNLMNYLKIQSIMNPGDSSFYTIAALNYSEYKTVPTAPGLVSTRSNSIAEQNPIRTSYQRDALIRQLSGTDRRRTRSRQRDGVPATGSSTPIADAMRLRPDYFFLPDNAGLPGSTTIPTTVQNKKIYDKYLYFSFRENLEPAWYQLHNKEFFLSRELNSAYFTENKKEIISIACQHNKKDKLELLVSMLDKETGTMKESLIPVNGTAFPVFSQPSLKLKENEYIFIYTTLDNSQTGICRLSF